MGISPEHSGRLSSEFSRYRRRITWSQIVANLAGAVTVTSYFAFFFTHPSARNAMASFTLLALMFPVLVLIATINYGRWEKDLIDYLRAVDQGHQADSRLQISARRKILDQPFVAAALTGINWLIATVVMVVYEIANAGPDLAAADLFWRGAIVFVGIFISGAVTVAIVFFATDRHSRRVRPLFFPRGGVSTVPGAFKLPLRNRMLVIFILTSILPVTLMAVLSFSKARMMLLAPAAGVIKDLLELTTFVLAVTLVLAIVLSRYFATGILKPIQQMETAMRKVATGDFSALVPVVSNDELGSLSDHFNHMTDGLKERDRMKQSLALAKEVQQSLLPSSDPESGRLDIAGTSIYCDETGGDYYDYLDENILSPDRYGIVLGDVSGHGLPSALMMATVRAAVRQRAAMPGAIGQVISDVNRQFCRDVEESGGFVTLFFLVVDKARQRLEWVRAGHDPALLYDPGTDGFEKLAGDGVAVGLTDSWQYESNCRDALAAGQVILLGTDGIWETRNPEGTMFGRQTVRAIIRRNHRAGAAAIREAILTELAQFRQGPSPEDDVTLVVIKILSLSPEAGANNGSEPESRFQNPTVPTT